MSSATHPLRAAWAVALVVVLTACGARGADPADLAGATDVRAWVQPDGTRLEIPADPQRIAALDVVAAMMLVEAGRGDRMVAHLRATQNLEEGVFEFPEASVEAGTDSEPNLELIAAQQPDLIIAYDGSEVSDELAAIAPTAFVSYEDGFSWREYFVDAAELAGVRAAGTDLVTDVDDRIADLADRIPAGTSLAVVRAGVGGLGAYPGFYPTDLVTDLGLETPEQLALEPDGKPCCIDLSFEQLADLDADAIFVAVDETPAGADTWEQLQDNPVWQNHPAVQAGQAFRVSSGAWISWTPVGVPLALDDVERYLVR